MLPASIDRSSFKAKQVPSFPIPVIREAVINAIVHRDYTKEGAKIQLDIYPDRIIVKSPGKPVPPITIEALKNFTATSYSRNKKLTFIFNEMEYMEESALGMDTFKSLRKEYKLPLPIVDYDGSNVVVTFARTTEAVEDVLKVAAHGLSKSEWEAFELFRDRKEHSKSELVTFLNLPQRTAERYIKKFVDTGMLKKTGSGRSTKYLYNG